MWTPVLNKTINCFCSRIACTAYITYRKCYAGVLYPEVPVIGSQTLAKQKTKGMPLRRVLVISRPCVFRLYELGGYRCLEVEEKITTECTEI